MSDECADTPIVESVHFVECAYQRITESERCHKETFLKQRDSIVGKAIALLYLLERCCKINKIPPKRTHFHAVFFIWGRQRWGVGGLRLATEQAETEREKASLRRISIQTCTTRRLFPTGMSGCRLLTFPFYFFTSYFLPFKRSLLCIINKACLHCKQGFFSLQRRLLFKPEYARLTNPLGSCQLQNHQYLW